MKLKDELDKQNKQIQEHITKSKKSRDIKNDLRKFGSMVLGIMGIATLLTMPGFGVAAIASAVSLNHGTNNKKNKFEAESKRLESQIANNNKISKEGIKASPEAVAARTRKIKTAENKLIEAENKLKSNKTKIGITNFLQGAGFLAGAVFGAVPGVWIGIAGATAGIAMLKHSLSIDNQKYEVDYQTKLGEYNNLVIERNIVNQYSKRKTHASGKEAADDISLTYGKEKESATPVTEVEEEKKPVELEEASEIKPSVDAIDIDYEVVPEEKIEEKVEEKSTKRDDEALVDAYLKSLMEPAAYEATSKKSK